MLLQLDTQTPDFCLRLVARQPSLLRMHGSEVTLHIAHLHNSDSLSLAPDKQECFPFFLEGAVLIQKFTLLRRLGTFSHLKQHRKNIYNQVTWSRSEK